MQLSLFNLPTSGDVDLTFTPIPDLTKAEQLKRLAQSFQEEIDYLLNPAIARQNLTKRRSRIAGEMRSRGEDLQEIQGWLFAMSSMAEVGQLPSILYPLNHRSQLEVLLSVKNWNDKDLSEIFSRSYYSSKRATLLRAKLTSVGKVRQVLTHLQNAYCPSKVTDTELTIRRLEQSLIGLNIPGFYPTPKTLGEKLIKEAEITSTDVVLEPSAGIGSLLQLIKATGAQFDCIEKVSCLANILRHKGFCVIHDDFLKLKPKQKYTKVVMNPPFERGQDCLHIQRAYDWLIPAGKLVAIASHSITCNSRNSYKEFRDWLNEVDASINPLPDGSFISSFRPTAVKTVMITIDKP